MNHCQVRNIQLPPGNLRGPAHRGRGWRVLRRSAPAEAEHERRYRHSMFALNNADTDDRRSLSTPDRPGPQVFGHVAITGHGTVKVDRWPQPRVAVARAGQDIALRGDPDRLPPQVLVGAAAFIEAPPVWEPMLRRIGRTMATWDRVIAELPTTVRLAPSTAVLLGPSDASALAALPSEMAWIGGTWGGPDGLASAGVARGWYVGATLVAVAVPAHVGFKFEDVGVVTAAAYRRRGIAVSCASAVCSDIRGRGRTPSWSTSPDNVASLAVAARLGFTENRNDLLYAFNLPIPS
jgi:GNAT superfamily N-acetyltransferase